MSGTCKPPGGSLIATHVPSNPKAEPSPKPTTPPAPANNHTPRVHKQEQSRATIQQTMPRTTRGAATQRPSRPPNATTPSPAPPQLSEPETVDESDLCPICHLLLHRPVRTTCGHTLCAACMAHWADVSAASAHMTIVPLTAATADAHPMRDAHPGLVEARCPMCRTVTTAARDAARERELRGRYPAGWAEREREEGVGEGGAETAGDVETVTVFVGNTHKLLQDEDEGGGNRHEWTFFLRLSDEQVVEKVQILLVGSALGCKVVVSSGWVLMRTVPSIRLSGPHALSGLRRRLK